MSRHSEALGEDDIGKLLLRLSAPATVGMVVMGMYNIADTIFVGRALGDASVQGIGGISICFPIQMLMMALSLGIGIGGASVISRSLGKRDMLRANRTFGNIMTMSVLMGLIITVVGSVFIDPMLKVFGATESIMPYALDYMSIILLGTVLIFVSQVANNVVRAEGNAKVAMYTMLVGAGLNILLDPVFIFWLDMGVKGAAIATVISQFIGMMSLIYYFVRGSSVLEFSGIGLDPGILREVFSVGMATFARNGSASVVMLLLNNVLGVYGGDMAIAVYGIFNRMFMFSAMPTIGLIQGMQPILGFNYGAGQYARVKDTVMLCVGLATAISVLGFLIMFLFPDQLFSIFSKDVSLIGSGAGATRIMVLMMPLLGFQFVVGAMYQALGKARPALILSVTRQMLFLIPFVLILPYFFGLKGVWMAFPVSDLLTFVLTLFFFMNEYDLLVDG